MRKTICTPKSTHRALYSGIHLCLVAIQKLRHVLRTTLPFHEYQVQIEVMMREGAPYIDVSWIEI